MAKTNQTMNVYNKLRERIEKNYYSPSESLPEIDLASEYGVSRNTIKKALLMLENDAYVTIEQNKGAKVRSHSKDEVLDYMDLRTELEGYIVRIAVPAFTEEDFDALDKILHEMATCRAENKLLEYSDWNREFHAVIYRACPNRVAADFLIRLKRQMRKYDYRTILVLGRDSRSYEEHRQILEALRNRDAVSAEAFMRKHVSNVRDTYDKYYTLLF